MQSRNKYEEHVSCLNVDDVITKIGKYLWSYGMMGNEFKRVLDNTRLGKGRTLSLSKPSLPRTD